MRLQTDLGAGYIGGEEEDLPACPSCMDNILLTTTTSQYKTALVWLHYLLQQPLVLPGDV